MNDQVKESPRKKGKSINQLMQTNPNRVSTIKSRHAIKARVTKENIKRRNKKKGGEGGIDRRQIVVFTYRRWDRKFRM